MVTVINIQRKSPILSPSSLACLSHIPAVNLTSGCAHNCIYCYTRGYSIFPGESKIVIYENTLDKLKTELANKRAKPRVVYFSPSSDIFQPVPEVIELSHTVLEFLLSRGIGVAFLTKGYIPEKTFKLLLAYPDKVRAQIGIITVDESIRHVFEPNAADVSTRLGQIAKLIKGGIATEARIIPILPGITDIPDSISQIFNAISHTGVTRAAISTLFLRPAIISALKRHIADENVQEKLLRYYRGGERLAVHAKNSSIIPLSRSKREEIYSRFRRVARQHDIELSVCGCMNPDIGGTCNITGKWPLDYTQPSLLE